MIRQEILYKLFEIIKQKDGVTLSYIYNKCNYHHHTIRKALKLMVSKGVVSFNKIGSVKIYYTMKNKLLMVYTKKERDEIYYNYLQQHKFGVNLNQISIDLKMDKRRFKKEIQRLINSGIVAETKLANMLIYKVIAKLKKKHK